MYASSSFVHIYIYGCVNTAEPLGRSQTGGRSKCLDQRMFGGRRTGVCTLKVERAVKALYLIGKKGYEIIGPAARRYPRDQGRRRRLKARRGLRVRNGLSARNLVSPPASVLHFHQVGITIRYLANFKTEIDDLVWLLQKRGAASIGWPLVRG